MAKISLSECGETIRNTRYNNRATIIHVRLFSVWWLYNYYILRLVIISTQWNVIQAHSDIIYTLFL